MGYAKATAHPKGLSLASRREGKNCEPEENTGLGVGEERRVLQLGQELGFYSRCNRKSRAVFFVCSLCVLEQNSDMI